MAARKTANKAKPERQAAPRASKPRAAPSKSAPRSAAKAKPSVDDEASAASELIDQRIRDLGGWRGETLARMRALIHDAAPDIVEEVKWRGTPVWSHNGIVCTGESYAKAVKLTFAHGAQLPDPSRLFNASLEGGTRRAIDIPEGGKVDAVAFKKLIKAAVARNTASTKKR